MKKLFVFFLMSFSVVFAQNSVLNQQAKQLFETGDFKEATPIYEKIFLSDTSNIQVKYKLALCYLYNYNHDKALRYLKSIYKKKPTISSDILFELAQAEHNNYLFDDAERHYRSYASRNESNEDIQNTISKMIEECTLGRELMRQSHNIVIKNLGSIVNGDGSEHSPVLSQNGKMLLFAAARTENKKSRNTTADQPEDIFVTYKDSLGLWSEPKKVLAVGVGDKAPIQLIEKDSKLIFFKQTTKSGIYVSTFTNNSIGTPSRIRKDNGTQEEIDAFVSNFGKSIIISSTDDNSNGTHDLYISKSNKGGVWEAFKKLPGKVNTADDEVCPFMTPDGKTLYFSSNGHNTIGGFDIFKSSYDSIKNEWKQPVNLGVPLNTPGDDIYFYFTSSNIDKGVFASYRPGGYGEKDLYEVINLENSKNVRVKGKINELGTNKPIGGVEVSFIDISSKNIQDRNVIAASDNTYDVVLLINKEYEMVIKSAGEIIESRTYKTPITQDKTNYYIINDIQIKSPK